MKFLEQGEQIETTIVAITKDYIFLDLNTKSEGVLDALEVTSEDGEITVKEGDKIKVFFLGEKHGEMRFTTKISSDKADKSMLEKAYSGGIPVDGFVEKEIKGGFEVRIGQARAFCPYSQMGYRQKEEPSFYIGKHLTFVIQEYKENGRNILVSNRVVCEQEHADAIKDLQETLKEGITVKGTVASIQSFGAFVMIEGFQALLPISEIALSRVDDINKHLKVGQEIEAKILKTDWKNEKISISTKALLKSPWETVKAKYGEETKHKGTVSKIADFGLFVKLEEGLEGLVHISEIQSAQSGTNLRKLFKTGDVMHVVIQSIDTADKRISLRPAVAKEQESDVEYYLDKQDKEETYNPFAALLKK